ncbi:hypothetical protein BHE74_00004560, partial [Ensete ventricosum]
IEVAPINQITSFSDLPAGQGLPDRLHCQGISSADFAIKTLAIRSSLFKFPPYVSPVTRLRAVNKIHSSSSQQNLQTRDGISFVTVYTIYNSSIRSDSSRMHDGSSELVTVANSSYRKAERSMAILNVFVDFIQVINYMEPEVVDSMKPSSGEINGVSILLLPCAVYNWTPPEGAGQFHGMPLDGQVKLIAARGERIEEGRSEGRILIKKPMTSVPFSISAPPPPASAAIREPILARPEDDPPNTTTALLSTYSTPDDASPSALRRPHSVFLFSALVITTCTAVFAFLFFTSSAAAKDPNFDHRSQPRPLARLSRPVLLLISSDGFRFGYQFKTATPNIHRLIANGTEAETGLIPVFPSLTFPNHYSIVTGLYPPHHGIINNHFVDPVSGAAFNMGSHEPEWWLGEPLWETAVDQGFNAATVFWPGSEVKKGSWDCPPRFCRRYDGSVPFEERVDAILSYFDLPSREIPVFMTLYFEDPDEQGHKVGADDPEITAAVARIDDMIGRLMGGLEKRGILEDVTIILLGDHGMVGTCDKKLVFLDDLSPWIKIPRDWVQSTSPLLAIRPPAGVAPSDVVAKMNEALGSGKVEHGSYLKMYLKEDLPERLHYRESDRIPPVIGLLEEGYKVEQKRRKRNECGGAHGYDNAFFSMRSIFVGHGPRFQRGRKVPSFENVEIYNVIASILNLKGAPNDGSASFPSSILLSHA